jgi:DHA2 family metal-tetracycline-proton antiporter-like MFS transporter
LPRVMPFLYFSYFARHRVPARRPGREGIVDVVKQGEMNVKKLVPWIVYLIFLAVLNETVFNVSTPRIAEQFGLTPSGVGWIMTIFMIFFGIGSVIYGKLSDIYSLRRLIVIGIIVYNVGSLAGFVLRFSYPLVVLARAVQGIGASALPALIFVVVARYFSAAQRGRIFGVITSTVSFAIGLGPVIGGLVSGMLGWAYLFLIPFLMLVSIPFFNTTLPREPRGAGMIDRAGAVLVALTVGMLIVYLNFSRWYYLLAFVLSLAAFILRITRAADPFIQPSLFRNMKFRNGLIVGFCLFSIVIGILFLIPLMLHDIHGLNTTQIGLILFPGAISSVIFGPIAGTLADRKGNSFVVAIGLILLVASMIMMSLLLSGSALIIAVALLLTYVGFSLFQTAMINSISQTLPQHETGVGMGLFNLVSIVSGAVGTALVGKLLDGKALDFSLLPIISLAKTFAYSNLLLMFSIVVVLGGVVYLYSFRRTSTASPLKKDASGS